MTVYDKNMRPLETFRLKELTNTMLFHEYRDADREFLGFGIGKYKGAPCQIIVSSTGLKGDYVKLISNKAYRRLKKWVYGKR